MWILEPWTNFWEYLKESKIGKEKEYNRCWAESGLRPDGMLCRPGRKAVAAHQGSPPMVQ
jgi:hypothetical protein